MSDFGILVLCSTSIFWLPVLLIGIAGIVAAWRQPVPIKKRRRK